jgi:2,4-dienoyl-CoA reductase-like NADH-dependent reductase (Old Yellow Enzyme family)
MADLFELVSINGMSLANRFVRSATWEGLADKDGAVMPKLTTMMIELARNDVGLIISSFAFVSPEGKTMPGQLAVYDDRHLPGLREMVQAVHSAGGKMALQIVHGGLFANPALTGREIVGSSAGEKGGRFLRKEEIPGIISAFANAARRAKRAGFDAVQLHAAHGFLLNQFLSPAFNKRTDEFGGRLENRARLLLEVVKCVREAVGPDYPILVKLSSEDFLEGGLSCDEAIQVAVMLEKASVDSIELSGGTVASPEKLIASRPGNLPAPEQEVYYREAIKLYKQKVKVPLMLVGGIRSYEVADELVRSGAVDYVTMSRPLICEPGLIKRWREGDRRKAECISDNACFAPGLDGSGIYCVTMAKKRSKADK